MVDTSVNSNIPISDAAKNLDTPSVLYFPLDHPNKLMVFSFESYDWTVVGSQNSGYKAKQNSITKDTIALPMPAQLIDNTMLDYSAGSMSPIGKELTDYVSVGDNANIKKIAHDTVNNLKNAAKTAMESNLDQIIDTVLKNSTVNAQAFMIGSGAMSAVGGNLGAATGKIVNPNAYYSFEGVKLKSHNFSWEFAPASLAESNALETIITKFKMHSLPSLGNGSQAKFMQYPSVCLIHFAPDNPYLYKFRRCFLSGVSVNYSPYGPSFFKVSGAPVAVTLSLGFIETSIWTQNDLDIDPMLQKPAGGGTVQGWTKGNPITVSNKNRTLGGSTTGIGGLMGIATSFGLGNVAQVVGAGTSILGSVNTDAIGNGLASIASTASQAASSVGNGISSLAGNGISSLVGSAASQAASSSGSLDSILKTITPTSLT